MILDLLTSALYFFSNTPWRGSSLPPARGKNGPIRGCIISDFRRKNETNLNIPKLTWTSQPENLSLCCRLSAVGHFGYWLYLRSSNHTNSLEQAHTSPLIPWSTALYSFPSSHLEMHLWFPKEDYFPMVDTPPGVLLLMMTRKLWNVFSFTPTRWSTKEQLPKLHAPHSLMNTLGSMASTARSWYQLRGKSWMARSSVWKVHRPEASPNGNAELLRIQCHRKISTFCDNQAIKVLRAVAESKAMLKKKGKNKHISRFYTVLPTF